MNGHLGVDARVLGQVCRWSKEPSESLNMDWHRPVGDRLNLFRIRAYAVFTHDAPKKWCFARSEYALLEVGVQLMLAHKCKNLNNVRSLNFHVCLSAHSTAMDEYIIEVTRCQISHRSQQISNASVKSSSGID